MALAVGAPLEIVQGILPVKVTLAAAVTAGHMLQYDSGWKHAVGNTANKPGLVAGESGVTGDVITAYPMAVIRGFTGATPGATVCVADGGSYRDTTGKIVGRFVSATTAFVGPADMLIPA